MVAAIKKISLVLIAGSIVIICNSIKKYPGRNNKTGVVKISFVNTVKAAPLVLDSVEYTNPSGESYRISKLKYYISNITLNNAVHQFAEHDSYHLLDAGDTATLSFSFNTAVNNYSSISFVVGVDSIKNVSGAQSGALDPANGMFWTWNSGYVMFKLEGNSSASTIINHRIEYHIGGFEEPNSVLQTITLPLQLSIAENRNSEIIITADLDKLWHGINNVTIAATPATMTPGVLSKKIADNYNRMFSVKEVLNK